MLLLLVLKVIENRKIWKLYMLGVVLSKYNVVAEVDILIVIYLFIACLVKNGEG